MHHPDDLVRCVTDVMGISGQVGVDVSDPSEEPLELELLSEDAPGESDRTVIQSRPAVPPPLPPPALPPPAAGPPPLVRKAARVDPFSDPPAEPRLPMGASPDEKVQFFRERLKAKEDFFGRVRDAYQLLRDELEGSERELAGPPARISMSASAARDQAEQALTQLRAEHERVRHDLDAAQTELSRGVHETATLRQDAEERAQSLSQLLNETMQEREEENKTWSARLADGERKLSLLQEEVDHLASELDERSQQLAAVQGGAGELQAAMAEIRQHAQEDTAALAEKLENLQAENAALSSELATQRASVEIKEADLAAELARGEATANAVTEAQEAVQSIRAEWEAERVTWQEKEREAQTIQESLEQRLAEGEARQAELRGELEAVHEAEQQSAGAESRLVELEAELSSRDDEVNGLRSEVERLEQQRAEQEADSGARFTELGNQLDEKEHQLLEREAQLQAKEAQLQAQGAELQEKQDELRAELQAEVEAKEAQLQETQTQLQDAQSQLQAKEAELQEATSKRSAQEEKVSQAVEEAQQTEARAHSAEVELQRAEVRARAAEAEATEAERRARDAAMRITQLEASLHDADTRADAAQSALAKTAQPAPSSGSNPPSGDKALRVRLSDLTLELQTLRSKLAQAQGSGLSAEVARLRDELEAQRAENDFLTGELDRVQSSGFDGESPSDLV